MFSRVIGSIFEFYYKFVVIELQFRRFFCLGGYMMCVREIAKDRSGAHLQAYVRCVSGY